MGYSQKGYIDGELLAEWVKHSDRYTKSKAQGRTKFIFLDSHLSRINLQFLLYCRKNNIRAVCYLSHSTHIYQGLDVVVFSVLKRHFSDEMLKFEAKTGMAVNKSNFVTVYTPAHMRAFTKENIEIAFRKTGIHPFNPDAISTTQLKPSIESSTHGDGLPLAPTTPVRTVIKMLKKARIRRPQSDTSDNHSSDNQPGSTVDTEGLQSTLFDFLISSSPIKPSSVLPFRNYTLPGTFSIPHDLLSREPGTEVDSVLLQRSLQEFIRQEIEQYSKLIDLQA